MTNVSVHSAERSKPKENKKSQPQKLAPFPLPILDAVPAGAYALPVTSSGTRFHGRTLVVDPSVSLAQGDAALVSYGSTSRGGWIARVEPGRGEGFAVFSYIDRIGSYLSRFLPAQQRPGAVGAIIGELTSPALIKEAEATFHADNSPQYDEEEEAAERFDAERYLQITDELGQVNMVAINRDTGEETLWVSLHSPCSAEDESRIYAENSDLYDLRRLGGPAVTRKTAKACKAGHRILWCGSAGGLMADPQMPAHVKDAWFKMVSA